jgi:hypothetical protein
MENKIKMYSTYYYDGASCCQVTIETVDEVILISNDYGEIMSKCYSASEVAHFILNLESGQFA